MQGCSPKASSASRWKLPYIRDHILNNVDTFVPFMCLTETWLKSYISDAQVKLPNYNVFRSDRAKRKEGGVMMYIHEAFQVSLVQRYDDDNCEAVMCCIDTLKTAVICIYRPPDAPVASFKKMMKFVDDFVKNADSQYDIVHTGDYNLPNINWDTSTSLRTRGVVYHDSGETLLNYIGSNFLTQVIDSPTREQSILDLVITNNDQAFAESCVSSTVLSDHNLIRVMLRYNAMDLKTPTHEQVFDPLSFRALKIQSMNVEELNPVFDAIDWLALYNLCLDCYDNDSLDAFSELIKLTVLQICLNHADEKKPPAKRSRSQNVLCRKRRKLKSRLKCLIQHQPNSPTIAKLNDELSLLELSIQTKLIEETDAMEARAVNTIRSNPKYFFSYAKRLSKIRTSVGPLKDRNGSIKHKPQDMANILQGQYSSVFSNPLSPDIDPNASHTDQSEFCLSSIEVNQKEMIDAMAELDPNSAAPDGDIPARILKCCRNSLSKPLVILWSHSMQQGHIPSKLKDQFIAPVFKKGAKTDPANYRPVSLTSHVIKIFERVVRRHLVQYLEGHNLISAKQHGFRKGRSCLTQLLNHIDNIMQNLLDGCDTDVVYLDYAKAFDKVDHAILLTKLKRYGITGQLHQWLTEFLTNRQQVVTVNGQHSHPAPVLSGVPQGTVLGPILFILYINDLEKVLSEAKNGSFADDTRLSHTINISDDTKTLQRDLNSVVKWSRENNMQLHEDKFELLCYRNLSKNLLRSLPFSDEFCQYLTPGGFDLLPKHVVKDLGVYLDDDLSWSHHYQSMISSANKMAAWVLGAFKDRSKFTMLHLYKSLIRCRLEYCCPVWDPSHIKDIQALEDVQRHFTARISGFSHMDYHSRLKNLKLQSLQRRRERYSIIHIWKIINGFAPNDIDLQQTHNARRGLKILIPPIRPHATQAAQSLYDNSFSIRAGRLWNTLPMDVNTITELDTFKSALGRYLDKFPDLPPVVGYPTVNNSILDWSQSGVLGGLQKTWRP